MWIPLVQTHLHHGDKSVNLISVISTIRVQGIRIYAFLCILIKSRELSSLVEGDKRSYHPSIAKQICLFFTMNSEYELSILFCNFLWYNIILLGPIQAFVSFYSRAPWFIRFRRLNQCDQMARLYFNIWPFKSAKICPMVYEFCQSRSKILPNNI